MAGVTSSYPAALDSESNLTPPNNGDTLSVADHWLAGNSGPIVAIENFVGISSNNRLVPVGSIMPYSSDTEPSGWFICDGRTVSRTTYADLFSALSTVWGYGDNSTTFNIPDFRGRFLRGHDDGAGRDPDAASRTASNTGGATGDNVGSVQGFTIQDHQHATSTAAVNSTPTLYVHRDTDYNTVYGRTNIFSSNKSSRGVSIPGTGGTPYGINTTGISVLNPSSVPNLPTPTTQTDETRPINANVNYIIKY